MTKSSKTWWLPSRFRDRGILPTPRLILLFIVIELPIVIASFIELGWISFLVMNGIVLIVSLLDLLILPGRDKFSFRRSMDNEVDRDQDFTVVLNIENSSNIPVKFSFIDDLPPSFSRPFPIIKKIGGNEAANVSYLSKAFIRGDYELKRFYFRYQSNLGLWEKQMVYPLYSKIKVIPDMSQVRAFLAEAQQFLYNQGMKVKKNRIGGGEFTQIRNYVVGDDPRKINWRQTAKVTELMTNVYEPEHGKHITLMIDCGRIMGVELKKGNRLERSIEAALTIAAVALKRGDYVSVMAFSNRVKTYIPLGKGIAHLQTIIKGIYNVQSDPIESNYDIAFNHLETVQKRRSFILLFSDLDPFLYEDAPLFYIEWLRRRHLFLLMGIADPIVTDWINKEPTDTKGAMIKSTAQKQSLIRKKRMRRWDRMGLQMIEVPEEKLAAEALSRYIEIINRGLL